jgi:hypothetical protein
VFEVLGGGNKEIQDLLKLWRHIPSYGDRRKHATAPRDRIRQRRRTWRHHLSFYANHACPHFASAFPFAPGNLCQDRVARRVDMSRFKSRTRAGNVTRHRFFGPGRSRCAHKNWNSESNPRASASFSILRAVRWPGRQLELQAYVISALRILIHPHHVCRSFGLRCRGAICIERKRHPHARADLAGFGPGHANSISRGVKRARDLDAHTQRTAPANPGRHAQLGPWVLAHFDAWVGRELAHCRLS